MTKWAILIGVDTCPGLFDLPGCFNDVKRISDLLRQQYGFRRENMVEMTCSDFHGRRSNADFDGQVKETFPTYENIVSSFRTLEIKGKPGDLAYIHFSGVIIAERSILPAYADFPTVMDLAFLTAGYEAKSEGKKWLLHDVELSALLNSLSKKGMEVTAILDCRAPRMYDFPSSRSNHSLLRFDELEKMSYGTVKNHFPDSWMRNPVPQSSYTLMTSFDYYNLCPEKGWGDGRYDAEAVEDKSQEKLGFLTSWLLDALLVSQTQVDFKQLLNLMKAIARNRDEMDWPKVRGHEMLAGDASRVFPGNACTEGLPRIPPAHVSRLRLHEKKRTTEMEIEAGSVHGLAPSDKIVGVAIRPDDFLGLASPGQSTQMSTVGTFQITKVNPFSSVAIPFGEVSNLIPRNVELGAIRILGSESTDHTNPQHMTPHDQSLHYQKLLGIQSPGRLRDSIDINIAGGYRRCQNTRRTVYPSFDRFGQFHVLSDDYVVIHLRNRSSSELSVNVLAFDAAFGICKVYPTLDDPATAPILHTTNKSMPYTEASIELRMALDSFSMSIEGECHATEVLKVFFTDRHISLSTLEVPRIWQTGFLAGNRDPAATRYSTAANSRHPLEDLAKSQVKDGPRTGVVSWSPDAMWYCHDLSVIIHKTARSLEDALGIDAS